MSDGAAAVVGAGADVAFATVVGASCDVASGVAVSVSSSSPQDATTNAPAMNRAAIFPGTAVRIMPVSTPSPAVRFAPRSCRPGQLSGPTSGHFADRDDMAASPADVMTTVGPFGEPLRCAVSGRPLA